MTIITPGEVVNILTNVKSAKFVGLTICVEATGLNKTNGKRKASEKVVRKWWPVVKVGTYRGQINRDWEIAVQNARLDEGLDPDGWEMDSRRNGLKPAEDRPASTLVEHPEFEDRRYLRLVHRVSKNGTEIQVDKSRYFWGEGGPVLNSGQLGPYFGKRKETELQRLARYQGDPGHPLVRPVMYRDITLTNIRGIRAHGEVWVVTNPIISFPPPEAATREVEGATGADGVEVEDVATVA